MPFFTDPFLARSLCFSGQPQDVRSSVNAPIKLKTLALFLDCFVFFFIEFPVFMSKLLYPNAVHIIQYATV